MNAMTDDVREKARALCDQVEDAVALLTNGDDPLPEESTDDLWKASYALRAALDAAESGDAASVIPAETGPCYDAHGVERPPNPECVMTTTGDAAGPEGQPSTNGKADGIPASLPVESEGSSASPYAREEETP